MENVNQEAAIAIRHALMNGGSLEGIALEIGKLAALYPVKELPTYEPLFQLHTTLEMMNAYNEGVMHIERMFLTKN